MKATPAAYAYLAPYIVKADGTAERKIEFPDAINADGGSVGVKMFLHPARDAWGWLGAKCD